MTGEESSRPIEIECEFSVEPLHPGHLDEHASVHVECYPDSEAEEEAHHSPACSSSTRSSSADERTAATNAHEPQPTQNEISLYEKERLANIEANQAKLAMLGLTQTVGPKRAVKTRRSLEPTSLNFEPVRRSMRASAKRASYAEEELAWTGEADRRGRRLSPWVPDPNALDHEPGTILDADVPEPRARPAKRARQSRPSAPERTDEEEAAAVKVAREQYRSIFLAVRKQTNGGRADLKAMRDMREADMLVNQGSRRLMTGDLPGLPVGTIFYNRAEMQVLGIHGKWLGGIDYVTSGKSETGESYVTAICSSGGYEDDEDHGETLWYTGEGGNDLLSSRRQTQSQTLVKGNLALYNSMQRKTPVRLLRCLKDDATPEESYTGKLYSYDGLYLVTKYKYETGTRHHGVCKFFLVREPGQPPLASHGVRLHKRLVELAKRDGTAGPRHGMA